MKILLINKNFNDQKHPFHLVDPSPWPLLGAFGAFEMTFGGVMYMHGYQGGFGLLCIGFLTILYTIYSWWRDIIREANFEGVRLFSVMYVDFNFLKSLTFILYLLCYFIFNFDSSASLSFCMDGNGDLERYNEEIREQMARDRGCKWSQNRLYLPESVTNPGTHPDMLSQLPDDDTPLNRSRRRNEALLDQACAQHWESLKSGLTGGSAVGIGILAMKISPSHKLAIGSAIVGGYAVNQILGFMLPK